MSRKSAEDDREADGRLLLPPLWIRRIIRVSAATAFGVCVIFTIALWDAPSRQDVLDSLAFRPDWVDFSPRLDLLVPSPALVVAYFFLAVAVGMTIDLYRARRDKHVDHLPVLIATAHVMAFLALLINRSFAAMEAFGKLMGWGGRHSYWWLDIVLHAFWAELPVGIILAVSVAALGRYLRVYVVHAWLLHVGVIGAAASVLSIEYLVFSVCMRVA